LKIYIEGKIIKNLKVGIEIGLGLKSHIISHRHVDEEYIVEK